MADQAISVPFWNAGRRFTPKVHLKDLVEYRTAVQNLAPTAPGVLEARGNFIARVLDRQPHTEPMVLKAAPTAIHHAFEAMWGLGMRRAFVELGEPNTFPFAAAWHLVRPLYETHAEAVETFAQIRRAVVTSTDGPKQVAKRIARIRAFDAMTCELIAVTEEQAWWHRRAVADHEAVGQTTYTVKACREPEGYEYGYGEAPCRRCLPHDGEVFSVYDFVAGPPFHPACKCEAQFDSPLGVTRPIPDDRPYRFTPLPVP